MALGRKEEAHHIKQLGERANQELGIEKVIFLEHTNLEPLISRFMVPADPNSSSSG
jgi:hypothetical protein